MTMDYRLQDLVDIPKLQALLDSLYVSSGIPSAIIDLEGNVLTGAGWQDICTKFHRVNPDTLEDCIHSDVTIAAGVSSSNEHAQITCPRGLTDTATPLIIEGKHLANVFTGQLFITQPDREFFRRQAGQFGFDETAYMEAFDKVPFITQKQLDEYLTFIAQLSELLAVQGLTQFRILKAQADLQKNEGRFRTILQTAMDGFWLIDSGGHFLAVNAAYCSMSGYSQDELLRMSVAQVETVESPEDVQAHLQEVKTGRNTRFETTHRRKDGRLLQVDVSVQALPEGEQMFVFLRDITERKQAELALKESEERYRAQFDLASEGIFTLSPEGNLVEVNEAFARMHGYTRSEMLNMNLKDLDTPQSSELVPERMRRLMSGEQLTFDVEHRHKDGHVFPMEVSASLVTAGGKPRILCFHRDITERRRAEEERRRFEARLQQSQKMESLGSLAGGVAHDMNNVLGAILALASANIDAQPAGSATHRALDTITKAAVRGGKLVKGLLSFARQTPAEERKLDMNSILQEEVRLLERTTLAKIHLEMDLEPELRPVRGDPGALTHAFMNLCVNAVDAMPENGTLTLRTRNVDNNWIEVLVEDTGCGMRREVLDRAMDPFFTTKESGKGTGLGLSMVYSTMKAHQGQMEIQSQPGEGTRVRMRFPACEYAALTPEPAVEPRSTRPNGALKVFLVDDDELIQSSVQAILEVLGHAVTSAWCGEEALAKIESGFKPDLVILDMNMPGLGGSGTLPRLRALCPIVPVMLATGRADQTALDLIAAHPQVTLLSKPFSLGELEQHLGRVAQRV